MVDIYGNILICGKTFGFSTPEEFINILIDNGSLNEFLAMVDFVCTGEVLDGV